MIQTQLSRPFLNPFPFPFRFSHVPSTQTQPFSTLSSLLDLCTNPQHLRQIHARFILRGLDQNPTFCSKLVDCYADLGHLNLSYQVFSSVINPNPTLYNTILQNLSKFGEFKKTILVYQDMVMKSMYADEYTYPLLLMSCSCLFDVVNGRKIHGHVVKLGFDLHNSVGGALADMYRNCAYSRKAGETVDKMHVNDLACWNSLIYEAFQDGNPKKSIWAFRRMRMEGIKPDSVTIVNILRPTVALNSLMVGKSVHCLAVVTNLCENLSVYTALLTMYSKLSSLKDARLLFDGMTMRDCVVWNVMIKAYYYNGYPEESIKLLMCMGRAGVRADMFTALAAISSTAELKSLKQGKQMHAHVVRNGTDYQVSLHNCLIDMYCKCDHLESARKIFDLVKNKTVVSWSSMIQGYIRHDQNYEALSLFTEMKLDGMGVDSITVINVLPACVNIGALEQVKYLHGFSIKCNLNSMPSVNTALLISYAKCGCIQMARKLFDEEEIDGKDIITWNSMISAYSKHGEWFQCFQMYNQMKQSKLKPDQVTFLALLTACVNSGVVKEGWDCFKEMTETYACHPNQEHYACMVDLLGRSGHINEAMELIKTMPFKPDARVWGPLLSACKKHSEPRLAEYAAEKLIAMEPQNAGNYILLSNIYAAAGKWDGVAKMRLFLKDRGLTKTPGCSWLEINGRVHEFRVADRSHPKSDDIYTILGYLELEIKKARDMRTVPPF